MSKAIRRQAGHMPALLLFSGLAIGVVGASINKHAETVREHVVALSGRIENSDVALAIPLARWGLLLLVVGAGGVLAGLVVIALAGQHRQRRRAMDRRCLVASGCGNSAPSLRSKPSQRVGGARASEWRRCGQRRGALPGALAFDSNQTSRPHSAVTAQRQPDGKTLRSAQTQLCVTAVACQLSFARRLI